MNNRLIELLEKVKSNYKVNKFDEAKAKQGIILPVIHYLGWNIYDTDEVTPEYSVGSRKVDYSFRLERRNRIFLEAKKPSEDLDRHQEQLLDYSFRQGVEVAILCNGTQWWFYLPMKKGDWTARKFFVVDIFEQDLNDVVSRFTELLSKDNVISGQALSYAEALYEGRMKRKTIEKNLPDAWNRMITEPNPELISLLSEITEKMCGYKPEEKDIRKMLVGNRRSFLLDQIIIVRPLPKKVKKRRKRIPKSKSGVDLVLEIIQNNKGPVDSATLKKKTGLEANNLRMIVYRLKKRGLIRSSGKGIYEKVDPIKKVKQRRKGSPKSKSGVDLVLEIIQNRKRPVDTATLKKKTGLKDNNLRIIVYRLKKQSKIKSPKKGFYTTA